MPSEKEATDAIIWKNGKPRFRMMGVSKAGHRTRTENDTDDN